MRLTFATALFDKMKDRPDVYLLTGDLGFGLFDGIQAAFPDRFINCGAAEQVMVGMAIGLALENKIPFVYSITPFILARPFEWLRNYVNHEKIPVRLVGSGLDDDYAKDGITHHAFDAKSILGILPHIRPYFPDSRQDVIWSVAQMVDSSEPAFLCVRRKVFQVANEQNERKVST